MKKSLIAAIALVLHAFPASAVEYRTLKIGDSLATQSTDLIEVCGYGAVTGTVYLQITVDASTTLKLYLQDQNGMGTAGFATKLGHIITGATAINAVGTWVTVKISAPPQETPTQPTNAAAIPEDANGQYQVIMESSTDLITWTPANPGTYGGNTTKRFFRTRIVRLP